MDISNRSLKFLTIVSIFVFVLFDVSVHATTWAVCKAEVVSCDFDDPIVAMGSASVVNGDILNLTGSFNLNATLVVNKTVRLQGNDTLYSNITNGTISDGIVQITATGVIIRSLNIGFGSTAIVTSGTADPDGLNVSFVNINNVSNSGIYLNTVNVNANFYFANLNISGLNTTGIHFTNAVGKTKVVNSYFSNFTNEAAAIRTVGGLWEQSIIDGNTFADVPHVLNLSASDNLNAKIGNNTISNVTFGFSGRFRDGSNLRLNNFTNASSYAFNLSFSGGNIVENNLIKLSGLGIIVTSGSSTIRNNSLINNTVGINITSSSVSDIYNNYFNNTLNAWANTTQSWNTTKTAGANIIGGSWIAGNFWDDYSGTDTDGDGLGNTLVPYTASGDIAIGGDYTPLITPPDIIPPSSITNLNESSKNHNSITWQWTNPTDSDFTHTEVWLNGTFRENTTSNSTMLSSLNASTIYEIQLRPVDNLGNIGNWTNDTAQTNVVPDDGGGNNPGGGGGGGSSTPINTSVQQNKTTSSNTGTATVNVLPPETIVETETPKIETTGIPETSIITTAPTGFIILQKLKNPYFALLLAGILFASLTAYAVRYGKIKVPKFQAPKISMPKISLPRIKFEPKPQTANRKPPTKFEFPKISLPKFKAPEFSLPKFSMPTVKIEKKQSPQEMKPVINLRPNIVVNTPQIDYKKLARELKPPVEKPEPKVSKALPEMPLEKSPISAPPRSKPIPLNEHMKSLLSALGETEDEIMRTILMHGGRTTMARIFHETGIPPTTLLRWIISLENRELIKSTKMGKLRRIELTAKFLKGEA